MFPNYSTLEPAHRQQATGMQVWDLNRLKTVLSSFPTCEAKQETNSVCQRAQVEGEGHHTFVGANMGWAWRDANKWVGWDTKDTTTKDS